MTRKYLHTPEDCGDHDFDLGDVECDACGVSFVDTLETDMKDLREKAADAKKAAANAMAERDAATARAESAEAKVRAYEASLATTVATDPTRTVCQASVPGNAWDVILRDRDEWKRRCLEAVDGNVDAFKRSLDHWMNRAMSAERSRDELANLVGQAICMFTLAPGESIVDPIEHALTSGIESLIDRAHAGDDAVAQLRLSDRGNRRLAKELAEERDRNLEHAKRTGGLLADLFEAGIELREAEELFERAMRTGLSECERLRDALNETEGALDRSTGGTIPDMAEELNRARKQLAESQAREARLQRRVDEVTKTIEAAAIDDPEHVITSHAGDLVSYFRVACEALQRIDCILSLSPEEIDSFEALVDRVGDLDASVLASAGTVPTAETLKPGDRVFTRFGDAVMTAFEALPIVPTTPERMAALVRAAEEIKSGKYGPGIPHSMIEAMTEARKADYARGRADEREDVIAALVNGLGFPESHWNRQYASAIASAAHVRTDREPR